MSEMPKEIFVRPRSYGDGWSALQDTDTVKFAGDVKYLRADTIAETLDRAIEVLAVAGKRVGDDVLADRAMNQERLNESVLLLEAIHETLTELKKLRGEG
jgi:hypothetical protein